jgi:hypothetical protein
MGDEKGLVGAGTHPALKGTPVLKRCSTWGFPKTALFAPRRGFAKQEVICGVGWFDLDILELPIGYLLNQPLQTLILTNVERVLDFFDDDFIALKFAD